MDPFDSQSIESLGRYLLIDDGCHETWTQSQMDYHPRTYHNLPTICMKSFLIHPWLREYVGSQRFYFLILLNIFMDNIRHMPQDVLHLETSLEYRIIR